MWFKYSDQHFNIRHTCEHGDHLSKYGWTRHDGTSFGQQEILDNGLCVCIVLDYRGDRVYGGKGTGGRGRREDWRERERGREEWEVRSTNLGLII